MSQFKVFATVSSAYQLLKELGAPPQLIIHVKLVGEAAELLIAELDRLAICNERSLRSHRWGWLSQTVTKSIFTYDR